MPALLFICLIVFFVISVPIAVSLGYSSIVVLLTSGTPLIALAQNVFAGLDSFALMAIPFFVLAGNLMQSGGIARRLIHLANVLVGWIKGGLGAVAVLTSMFFATVSGSSSATTAAIGSILIPAMEKKGYPKNFAASISASSGELGAIIPPSIPMIVYGLIANVSVGSLFIAGIIPGILIGISLILLISIVAKIKGFDSVTQLEKKQWFKSLIKVFADSIFALLMPVLIIGGIYSGLFTPTESAVVAVVYGFLIGKFVYRELNLKDIPRILGKSAITTSIVLLIVAFASIFAHILTMNRVPHEVGEWITQLSNSKYVFLFLTNLLLFLTGMFMETLAAIIILAPILVPVATQFGINPVHFGIIMIVNLAVGMVTPPVGVNLFVACQIARLRIDQLIRPLLIFLAVLVVDVLIISYYPDISLWFIQSS